jgi:hypothetical protein
MLDPKNIDPQLALVKVRDIDAQLEHHKTRTKELTAERKVWAPALPAQKRTSSRTSSPDADETPDADELAADSGTLV